MSVRTLDAGAVVATSTGSGTSRFSGRRAIVTADQSASTFDVDRLSRFDAFAWQFRPVFPRDGQFQRFRAYLRGLLEPGDRKNVSSIAAVVADMIPGEVHLSQTLQHFVTQSPWDHGRLLATYRRVLAPVLKNPSASWVIHDGVVEKKGRHSVGVQRQFARSEGRKLNCQVMVVASQVGPHGSFPVAARLYLPANWLRSNEELARRTVPDQFRVPTSKSEVALNLLDELRDEGWPITTVGAEEGYTSVTDFAEGLSSRGVELQAITAVPVEQARRGFEELKTTLGLNHFEGRTWAGWHHHLSLVFAAFAFLTLERLGTEHASPFRAEAGTL